MLLSVFILFIKSFAGESERLFVSVFQPFRGCWFKGRLNLRGLQ